MRRTSLFIALLTAAFGAHPVLACDLCSLYSASQLEGQSAGKWTLGVSNQYTEFESSKRFDEESVRDGQITRSYSTTYFSVGHDFTDSFGLQTFVPVVHHEFDQVTNLRRSNDTETGFGDIVLTADYSPVQIREADYTFLVGVFGGVKFPTGDTGNLGSNQVEEEPHSAEANLRHHTIANVGNGRALTLGTGSYDFPIGASFFSRYDRFILLATSQYTFRTEGDFGYRFANDLVWDVGPGYYISLDHELTVAARIAVSGEYKPLDKQNGALAENSKVSNVYVGPQILLTAFEDLSVEVGVEARVSRDNSESVLPEWRVRSGLTYQF